MIKHVLSISLCLALSASAPWAEAKPPRPQEKATPKQLEAKLKANPNDVEASMNYLRATYDVYRAGITAKDFDASEKALDRMNAFLKILEPDDEKARQYQQRSITTAAGWRRALAVERTPLEAYLKRIKTDADDAEAINGYYRKTMPGISALARSNPDEAEKKLEELKAFFAKIKTRSKKELTVKQIDSYARYYASIEKRIEGGRKHANLIGANAAKLEVASWTNGKALSAKDLKGKVVLLDFWSVWCGPCIATFPHLRDWREKYADKGLIIIGLTRKYNYTWNAETGRASRRAEGENTETEEHAMLEQFAKHHKLKHVFAIQKDRAISDFYGVSGIPQVVLIDRQGKVHLIRVGSGEQNAQDVEAMLKKLIGTKTAARE